MRLGWLLLFACASCSSQPTIPPAKIVSNNPCVDAILAEVAEPSQIGAVSVYSHDIASGSAPLDWAKRFPALGAEAEAIILARPRLALIGAFGDTSALDSAGIHHLDFGVPTSVDESVAQVRTVARAVGRRDAGEALVREMLDAVKPLPLQERTKRTAIIWLSGGFVPGKGTLQDELLARAGYRNASETYGLKQWDMLPLESLIRQPPDIIFTPIKATGDNARTLALRERVLSKLSPKPKIIPFPERLLNCGGPSIVDAMKLLKASGV